MRKFKTVTAMVLTLSMLFGNTAMAATNNADGSNDVGGITVREEYCYFTDSNNEVLLALVSNDSDTNHSVSMDAWTLDANGNTVEKFASYPIYMAPGEIFPLYMVFHNSQGTTNYDYKLVVDDPRDDNDMVPMGQWLDGSFAQEEDNDIRIVVNNTSPYDLDESRAMVMYYDDGELVDFEDIVITNRYEGYMVPGESVTEYSSSDYYFNSVGVYITGQR